MKGKKKEGGEERSVRGRRVESWNEERQTYRKDDSSNEKSHLLSYDPTNPTSPFPTSPTAGDHGLQDEIEPDEGGSANDFVVRL